MYACISSATPPSCAAPLTATAHTYACGAHNAQRWNHLCPLQLLYDTFSAFGMVIATPKIMRDPDTGSSKGFGFVSFDGFEASDGAIEAMNGQYLCNRSAYVLPATRRGDPVRAVCAFCVSVMLPFWNKTQQISQCFSVTCCYWDDSSPLDLALSSPSSTVLASSVCLVPFASVSRKGFTQQFGWRIVLHTCTTVWHTDIC